MRIFKFLLLISTLLVGANGESTFSNVAKNRVHIQPEGPMPQSNFGGFYFDSAIYQNVYTYGVYNVDAYSTRNEVMGKTSSEIEVYYAGQNENDLHNFLILYQTTMEPQDNVAYANGLGNMFTDRSDATIEYSEFRCNLSNLNNITLFNNDLEEDEIVGYQTRVTFQIVYGDFVEYTMRYTHFVYTYDYDLMTMLNDTNYSQKSINIRHSCWTEEEATQSTMYMAQFMMFTTSSTVFDIDYEIESQYSIALGGVWGGCVGYASFNSHFEVDITNILI